VLGQQREQRRVPAGVVADAQLRQLHAVVVDDRDVVVGSA
jgi:hypothetical protein